LFLLVCKSRESDSVMGDIVFDARMFT